MRDRRALVVVTLLLVAACAAPNEDEIVAGEGVLPEAAEAPETTPGSPDPSPNGGSGAPGSSNPSPTPGADPCPGAAGCIRTVFVTSATYRAFEVEGIDGADAKCNALAAKSTHPKVAGRKFVAWISGDQKTPSSRFVHGTADYVLVDGRRIAKSFEALRDGLEEAITLDENGVAASGYVWSATSPNGRSYGVDCFGWTGGMGAGHAGRTVKSAPDWSSTYGPTSCSTRARIYCFER